MGSIDADLTLDLHRRARSLVVSVTDPLTEEGVRALKHRVFQTVKSQYLTSVVFDFSAIDSVDSHSLRECEQLINGVRVLGASVAVVALRPHVAATIVELGDFFSNVVMNRSVHAAIQAIEKVTS